MFNYLRYLTFGIVIGLGFAFPQSANAAYITSDNVNCRAAPNTSARVLSRLSQGQEVSVVEEVGGWSKLASPSCWVSSRFISENYVAVSPYHGGSSSYGSAQSYRRQSTGNLYSFNGSSKTKRTKAKRSANKTRRSSGSYGGSCPCSGGTVCIGPRGGRYCITSGGNKRYGV